MNKTLFLLVASMPFTSSFAFAKNTFNANPVWGNDTYGHLQTGDIVYQDDEIICLHGKSNKCYDKKVIMECGMPPESLPEKLKYQECKDALAEEPNK